MAEATAKGDIQDVFRKMVEEAETGVGQSKKTFQPPAVSTSTLGTWEKHTKGEL